MRATLDAQAQSGKPPPAPLVLDGDGLTLVSLKLDGAPLPRRQLSWRRPTGSPSRSRRTGRSRSRSKRWSIRTANTQLSGLYRSSGTYCTQCEAEGFRRITYFPDRPDVMAVYTTRIEADKAEAPVLLANGNLVESGDLPGGRHFAVWHDPHPKPSYLFALVGGDLALRRGPFPSPCRAATSTLRIYVEHGKEDRCGYAMDSLKRAMRWDEEAFGREYDLDIFMIVAVSDFNMGAMENKGLNVFNDKYVLAIARDRDRRRLRAYRGGDRARIFPQLDRQPHHLPRLVPALPEGRPHGFPRPGILLRHALARRSSASPTCAACARAQFVEDAGPLAHPVRPEIYKEINNFYTSTVYEKGAEVVRMVQTLIGTEKFRAGMDLYFERHDGEAATVEQFIQCFADASGRDLTQFMRWYSQAGTPEVTVHGRYDAARQDLHADCKQAVPPTPGQPSKQPMVIPLDTGLVGKDGRDLPLTLRRRHRARRAGARRGRAQTSNSPASPSAPVLSINRNFSAPIKLVSRPRPPTIWPSSPRMTAIRSTAGRRCRRFRMRAADRQCVGACAPARRRASTSG